ncbi:TRAP transporter small permease [Aeromicrobium phragmitis]|nr:TRAP transporter small permease [Aeromicrobium phragmitis]
MGVISRTAMAVASIWIAVLGLWITADALGRALGIYSFVGTVTIATESVVAISFLCMPYATRHDVHIRATLLVGRAGPRVTQTSLTFSYIAATVLFLFLTHASWEPFLNAWRTGEFSGEGGLNVTLWPFKLIVVTCAAAMTIESALAAARSLGRRGGGAASEENR